MQFITSKGLNRPTKPLKTMDRQKEIESLARLIELAIQHNQSLVKAIDSAKTKLTAMELTPEPKKPETWEEISKFGGSGHPFSWFCENQQHCTELQKFIKRLEIADYCGRREFIEDQENWTIEILDSKPDAACFKQIRYPETNYFPTKEAAEKYLRICLNSNLL